jgi:hypothetical protein
MPSWMSNILALIMSALVALIASLLFGKSTSSPKSDIQTEDLVDTGSTYKVDNPMSNIIPKMSYNPESIYFNMSTPKPGYVSDAEDDVGKNLSKYSDSLSSIRKKLDVDEAMESFDPAVNREESYKVGNGQVAGMSVPGSSTFVKYGNGSEFQEMFSVEDSGDGDDDDNRLGYGKRDYMRVIESAKKYDAFVKLKSKDSEVFIFPSGKIDPTKFTQGILIKSNPKLPNGEYPPRPSDKTEYTKVIKINKGFKVAKFSEFYTPEISAKLTAFGIDKLKTAADQKKYLDEKYAEIKARDASFNQSDIKDFVCISASPVDKA